MLKLTLLFLLGNILLLEAVRLREPVVSRNKKTRVYARVQNDDITYSYTTDYFQGVPVDHFSYHNSETFTMKYLYNKGNWTEGSPIFFYPGNEGYVEDFAENTGIIWDIAPLFNACVVFAEHRYYSKEAVGPKGPQMPYGNMAYNSSQTLGYLTSEQALADYAMFLPWFKANVLKASPSTTVIAFGGSYGGMLATWFRMKYPEIVNGSWAGSAPVIYFNNGPVPLYGFDKKASETLEVSGCNATTVVKAFAAIDALLDKDPSIINKIFHNTNSKDCSVTDNSNNTKLVVKTWVREALEYMAMTDYPYPTNFMAAQPGWPAMAACKFLPTLTDDQLKNNTDLATRLFNASMVFYNDGQVDNAQVCLMNLGQATGNLGNDLGWPWQECTEIIIYMCAAGMPTDVFWSDCDAKSFVDFQVANCLSKQEFGPPSFLGYNASMFRENAVQNLYGFDFSGTSNIIFTNGNLDPWSSGGVKNDTPGIGNANSRGIYNFYMDGAAHHLDLRQPNTCDPPPVHNARFQIVQIIKCWVDPNCKQPFQQQALPSFDASKATSQNCTYIPNGYPWNQTLSNNNNNNGNGGSGAATIFASFLTIVFAMCLAFLW